MNLYLQKPKFINQRIYCVGTSRMGITYGHHVRTGRDLSLQLATGIEAATIHPICP